MPRYRLSPLARADLRQILTTSLERLGKEGKRRYAMLIAAVMRKVAAEAEGRTTRTRGDLSRGIRSFHLRNISADDPRAKVRRPVHLLYYRTVQPGLVEIVRVLHERMEPERYMDADPKP
jgi:toxin ParE1/3/4